MATDYRIDELAREAGTTVRNVRAYQDRGLLPPPRRSGRVGLYTDAHLARLRLIGTMLERGYTLGNILSAQFFESAVRAQPEIPAEVRQGEFGILHRWLKEHLYQHGRKYTAAEIVERATGSPLTIQPYIGYLRTKFGEIYRL